MLRVLQDLENYAIEATDGEVGHVADFLLDDERWAVRYLVADDPGGPGLNRVLLSPIAFREVDGPGRRFHVTLTKEKIRHSPGIDLDKPVSRQHERAHLGYYGYPYYWGYAGVWGMGGYPGLLAIQPWDIPNEPQATDGPLGDSHLRSVREIRGYDIQATDGTIGHVQSFIVDDETWEIRYLVVDTSNWWFGKKVLISPAWATAVSWDKRVVKLDMTRAAIKASPLWNEHAPVNRAYELRLYDYHGKPVYWSRDARPEAGVARQQNV